MPDPLFFDDEQTSGLLSIDDVNGLLAAPEASVVPSESVVPEPSALDFADGDILSLDDVNRHLTTAPEFEIVDDSPETAPAFDAEGEGYDDQTAALIGMEPDDAGHMGSVAPVTVEDKDRLGLPDDSYVVLKGRKHPTFDKAVEAEEARGNEVVKRGNRYFSIPSERPGERERAASTPIELSADDLASPIPDSLIGEGRAIMRDAEATGRANDMLRPHGLPRIGTRVAVNLQGITETGEVLDAFTDEPGGDGVRISFDSGTELRMMARELAAAGVRILPESDVPQVLTADPETGGALSLGEANQQLSAIVPQLSTASGFDGYFEAAGRETGVDPALLRSIQEAETGGEEDPITAVSRTGNKGLMQLGQAAIEDVGGDPARVFDPESNILYAAQYLSRLKDQTGSTEGAVVAYHQGIDDYLAGKEPGPETRAYVRKVMGAYGQRPIVDNGDGTVSSERSITVTDPRINEGRATNIPSMFGGKQVSQDEAIQRIVDVDGVDPETGRALPGFDSIDEAVAAARERSNSLGVSVAEAAPRGTIEAGGVLSLDEVNRLLLPGAGKDLATSREVDRESASDRPSADGPFAGVMVPDQAEIARGAPSDIGHDLTASVARALPRGAIETAATALVPFALSRRMSQRLVGDLAGRAKRAAELSPEDYRALLLDVVRSGLPISLKGRIVNAARDVKAGKIRPEDMPDFAAEIEGNPPETAGRAMRSFAEETFPIPPEHEKQLPVKVARGVGSTAVFLGTRLIPGVGLPALAVTAGAIGSGEAIERAIRNGASDEQAARAGLMGVAPGLTDIIPIERLLKPVTKYSGFKGAIYAIARKMVVQGAIEGTQEGVQQLMQNIIARITSKSDQEITEGIAENGWVGFLVGMLFGAGAGAVQVAGQPKSNLEGDVLEEPFTVEDIETELPPAATDQTEPPAPGPKETPTAPIIEEPQVVDSPEDVFNRNPEQALAGLTDAQLKTVAKAVRAIASRKNRTATIERIMGKAGIDAARKAYLDAVAAEPKEDVADVRTGEFGGKVPLTQKQLERMLDDADAKRNRPDQPPEIKEQARRLQQQTIAELDAAQARILATDYGREWVEIFNAEMAAGRSEKKAAEIADNARIEAGELPPVEFTLNTARGRQAHFSIPAKPGVIGRLRERLAKRTAVGKFESVDLDAASRTVESAGRLGIATEGRDVSEIADEVGERTRPSTEEAPPEIVPRQGPSVIPAAARIELYDDGGTILTLPTGRSLEEARSLAENVARARGPGTAWRYIDNETGDVVYDTTGTGTEGVDVLGETAESRGAGASADPGINFTGFVRDTVAGEAAKAGAPLRRENILRPLLKALNVPLYQGRMKGRKLLGFYRRHIEEVRIKRMNDIETAAHEIAHMLDDRIPEIRKQWLPASKANEAIRAELRGVSYDQSKLFEGFAEFVRLWMTQADAARAKAPKVYGWFQDFIARNEHGPALRKAQTDMHAWLAQDAVSRARSKIGESPEVNAGLTSILDRFRQSVFDDLHGIMQAERELTGGIAPVGAYETARLTRGKYAMIDGALRFGAPKVNPDGSHSFVGKGLVEILDPVSKRLDDFLLYAVGRSARELKLQGRENLFTAAEIKGMVGLETPEFRTAFDEYQEFNRAVLDFAQSKGVINSASRANWTRTQYLPFSRVGQPGAFSTISGDWKGIRALTGGTDNLRDVLGNMIGNIRMLIDAALTNEARHGVTKLLGLRGSAKFLTRIPTESRIVKVHRAEVERQILTALGVKNMSALPIDMQKAVDQIIDQMEIMVPFEQRGQAPAGGNVVAVLRDGKPDYFEVADPLLFRSLTHLNRPTKNFITKLLSIPRRVGQSTITLTADFVMANLARDTLMATIMSRHGFKFMVSSARGMASRITVDQNYKDYLANGGGFASYLVDEDAFRTNLEQFYTRKGLDYKTVLNTPAKALFFLERIAEAFEVSARLGEFHQAVKRGENPRHAAYSAREVSTDFAMRGDNPTIGFFYDTAIFLKAGMNGIDRLYRGLVHDPNRGKIAAMTAGLAMISMALYVINRGNPLFDDLEPWDRDNNFHIFVPKPATIEAYAAGRELPPLKERYHHGRYPRIWELGAVASIAERSLETAINDDPDPADLARHTARIMRDVLRFEPIPQAFAPLLEQAMNRNRFFNRPIETQAMQSLEPWARSGPFTSPALRKLGEATRDMPKALQINPVRVEALLKGHFNAWAGYGLSLADALVSDEKADLRVDEYPGIRRFYQQEPPRSTRHVTGLYDALEAATQARRTMVHMDRTYRPDLAAEIENKPENLEYRQLTRARDTMRKIQGERNRVTRAKSLAEVHEIAEDRNLIPGFEDTVERARRSDAWNRIGALKRQLLDDITTEHNAFAKEVMGDVRAQRREKRAVR